MAIGIGTGTTVAFTTASGFTGEVLSVASRGASRTAVELAHMGTTGSIPKALGDLWNEGEIEVTLLFDPEDPPPSNVTDDTFTITCPDETTISGTGGITGREFEIPLEDRMVGSYVVTWTGAVTIS